MAEPSGGTGLSDADNVKAELLKGMRKADIIVPKLPLIDVTTKRRQDGRTPTEIRPLFVQTGVRSSVRGSSYFEMGNTKIICVINGPRDLPRKIDFSATGILSVEIQSVGGKVVEKDILLLQEALEAVIILEKFPKCLLEVSLTILENCGSTMAACVTAAGLALMEAGVPVYDLPVGVSLLFDGDTIYLDPTKQELETLDLTDSLKSAKGGGYVTMGYLPSREQICLFTMEGKMDPQFLSQCMDILTGTCVKIFAVIRHHSREKSKELGTPTS